MAMLVFVAFRRLAHVGSPSQVPDAILVFSAILPWQFFSTALSEASGSLTKSRISTGTAYTLSPLKTNSNSNAHRQPTVAQAFSL